MNLFKYKRVRPAEEEKRGAYSGWADLAFQTSLTLAITVVVGFFVGRWLDNWIGTSPVFLIIGTLWGAGMGMYWLIMKVKQFSEAQEEEEKESDSNPPESK